jgi:hypothetical protein
MSVALYLKKADDGEDRVVPISTERVFEDYWQPAAQKLGLKWVPLFQTGLPIESEDIPPVLDELGQLKAEFDRTRPGSADVSDYVRERLDRLIAELSELANNGRSEVYIG